MRGIVPWRRLVRLLLGAAFLCVAWVVLSSAGAQAAEAPRPQALLPARTSSLLPSVEDVTTATTATATATATVARVTGSATPPATAPLDRAVDTAVQTTRQLVGQTTRAVEGTTSSVPVAGKAVSQVTPVVR